MRTRLLPPLLAGALTAVTAVLAPLPSSTATAAPTAPTASAAPDAVWTPVDEPPRASRDGLQQRVDPVDFAGYRLDLDALERRLAAAPSEDRVARGAAPVTIAVPSPEGELVEFAVAESAVMEPGLAAAHPEITTWAGSSTGATPASIRLDVTPMGFHASVRGPGAAWYVDPAYDGADQGADALYLSYRGSDLPPRQRELVGPDVLDPRDAARHWDDARHPDDADPDAAPRVGEGGGAVAVQRTYRLALASDPSYAAAFGAANVTAEKVTLVNRVNQVYGDDLSVRLLLVNGNDRLNFNTTAGFRGPNGRCGSLPCYTASDVGCFDTVVDTNRYVLGQVVGADAYDVGHIVFGADGDGSGLAYLASVGTEEKAAGCTGLTNPVGDAFAVDYVSHELGHQFAATHTFNGTAGDCEEANREPEASVEPGSGSTVMGYAGICGIDNLQPHGDPVFGQRSQQQIADYTREAPSRLREVQSVALSDFGAGDAFTISYGGARSRAVTSGSTYDAAGLESALEEAEPGSATARVTGLWEAGTLDARGFTVQWSTQLDIARPTITPTAGSGAFTALVGVTDNGGSWTNQGYANPPPSGNRNPTVVAPEARTIPPRTPFELTGSATDPDGDPLVYAWEQNDPGFDDDDDDTPGTALNSNTKPLGPLFRVFDTYAQVTPAGSAQYQSPGQNRPGTSPTRSFPDLAQVVAGATNADTGRCPAYTGTGGSPSAALDCFSEFLPTSARTMSFRLTARDLGGPDGGSDGGTSYADTTINVAGSTPFRVTSQAAPTGVVRGTAGTITWDVAGTAAAPVSTADVRVTLSTDGGLTFPTVLQASTPNDGSADVTWPEVTTSGARVRVEAVGNYFYDVNDAAFTIAPPPPPAPTLVLTGTEDGATVTGQTSDPLPSPPSVTATSNTVAGSALTASAEGLPFGLDLTTTATTGESRTFAVTGAVNDRPRPYPVTVTVADGEGGADDRTVSFTIIVTKDDATVTYTGETVSSGDPLTLTATVVDADTPSGLVLGAVTFTDQTTGDQLCRTANALGEARCTVEVPVDRRLAVVATLSDERHEGSSAPVAVVVDPPDQPILAIGGGAGSGIFTAASSDPLEDAPTVVATSNAVPGSAITATAEGLPDGLSVAASEPQGSSRTFTLVGTADDDPAEYLVTMTVSDGDGNADDRTVRFVVAVVEDEATLTYTGDTTGTGAPLTLRASVEDDDAHPGPVTGRVFFTDTSRNEGLCVATIEAGVATCTIAAPASRTYEVITVLDSVRYTGVSYPAATVVVDVDLTPPTARITRGPAANAIVTSRDVVFEIASEPGASLTCLLRGVAQRCDDGRVRYRDLPAGTHELVVDAGDRAGNVDPRAATRRFTVPVDDTALAKRRGAWQRRTRTEAFRGSYLTTRRPGAWLTYRVSRATSLSLVVGTGPRRGRLEVILGDQRLRVFGTTSPTRRQPVVVPLARFATPRSGLVRVRTLNAAEVHVDGLAVVSGTPTGRPAHVSRAGLTL